MSRFEFTQCRKKTPEEVSNPKDVSGPKVGEMESEKPSIAVLPFNNMSGDPEQEYFSDGITEDIITAFVPHIRTIRHRPKHDHGL